MTDALKPKIPLLHIPSDDCAVMVGQVVEDGNITTEGTPHYVHIGEWVEVMPITSLLEVSALSRLKSLAGNEDMGGLDQSFSDLCRELSQRIISWNWTDMMGVPLAQPYQTPDVIMGRTVEEVMYLIQAATGQESQDDRKNGSGPSAAISSAAAPSPVSQS